MMLKISPYSDPNDCWSDPCLNGATCVDKHNNYSCVCPDGITGSRCETGESPIFITEKTIYYKDTDEIPPALHDEMNE